MAHSPVGAGQVVLLDAAAHDLVERLVYELVLESDRVGGDADRRPIRARRRGVLLPMEQAVGHLELCHGLFPRPRQPADRVRVGLLREAQLKFLAGKAAPFPKRPAPPEPRFAHQIRLGVALQYDVEMPQRLAEQVGGLEATRVRQPVKLPQPQLAQREVSQPGRRVTGVADEQALQPLYRVGQPVFLDVKIDNFQQRRATPVGRDVGGQVSLVQGDGTVRLAHAPQDVAMKIDRPRGVNRVGDALGQLHQVSRATQCELQTGISEVDRSQHVVLAPKTLG